jgi:hypothetical protein
MSMYRTDIHSEKYRRCNRLESEQRFLTEILPKIWSQRRADLSSTGELICIIAVLTDHFRQNCRCVCA